MSSFFIAEENGRHRFFVHVVCHAADNSNSWISVWIDRRNVCWRCLFHHADFQQSRTSTRGPWSAIWSAWLPAIQQCDIRSSQVGMHWSAVSVWSAWPSVCPTRPGACLRGWSTCLDSGIGQCGASHRRALVHFHTVNLISPLKFICSVLKHFYCSSLWRIKLITLMSRKAKLDLSGSF